MAHSLPLLQSKCHPQTIAVCQTRADGLGLEAVVVDEDKFEFGKDVCGVLVQYPATDGTISDYKVRGEEQCDHWGTAHMMSSRMTLSFVAHTLHLGKYECLPMGVCTAWGAHVCYY